MTETHGNPNIETIDAKLDAMQHWIENEFGHMKADVDDLIMWRKEFFLDEAGPWRRLNHRVDFIMLAIVIIVLVFALDKAPGIIAFLGAFL